MLGEPFRVTPQLPPGQYQTFSIRRPVETHWRSATCEEVDCDAYANGWVSIVPVGSQPEHLIRTSGRRFTEHRGALPAHVAERLPDGSQGAGGDLAAGLIAFWFEAGQACFRASEHRLPLERPELYVVRDGDWRANPTGQRRQHARPEHWVEEFQENQDRLRRQIEGG